MQLDPSDWLTRAAFRLQVPIVDNKARGLRGSPRGRGGRVRRGFSGMIPDGASVDRPRKTGRAKDALTWRGDGHA
jgi:hypothetical protein